MSITTTESNKAGPLAHDSSALTGSALSVEVWECRNCGKIAPCRVEITYEPTPYPKVEAQSRFRNRPCLCGEKYDTDWKRMPNCDYATGK